LVIGHHYAGLAEAELVADELERKSGSKKCGATEKPRLLACRKSNRHRTM
jgi:hypothetical protein